MKKRERISYVFIPIVMTIGMYVVFYSRIEAKPSDAGFWLIIAMGMSLGVALTRIIYWSRTKKSGSK
jgi:hypothetical protein